MSLQGRGEGGALHPPPPPPPPPPPKKHQKTTTTTINLQPIAKGVGLQGRGEGGAPKGVGHLQSSKRLHTSLLILNYLAQYYTSTWKVLYLVLFVQVSWDGWTPTHPHTHPGNVPLGLFVLIQLDPRFKYPRINKP